MSDLGTNARPLRVAVVGSGPSGFYAVEALFAAKLNVLVDMFERLPTPFGLVRYGVAPDHQKIKNVIKIYEKAACDTRFAYFGNVTVGQDITIEELQNFYDAVIFACGAQTDKSLGIPGEDLPGSYTATEFVAWYNGHPDYRNRTFDLSHETAVIVGQGNVAMDVSRILSHSIDELKNTDMAKHALDVLAESKVKEIRLVGRRGPVQASFTPGEIKEFGELKECCPVVDREELKINAESQEELDDPDQLLHLRNWEILQEFSRIKSCKRTKRFVIQFLRSPVALVGRDKVEQVIFERNKLVGEAGKQQAKGIGQTERIPCGIFFRSVGYRGVPIDGVPFSGEKGNFPNKDGRLIVDDKPVAGLYAVGWIKRGPSGVIGTNKPDSAATVASLLADAPALAPCKTPDTKAVADFLAQKKVRFINFADWKKIDAAEVERGKASGKPREKFVTIEEMLKAVGK